MLRSVVAEKAAACTPPRKIAATPATWGAAKLVPVAVEYEMLPSVAQVRSARTTQCMVKVFSEITAVLTGIGGCTVDDRTSLHSRAPRPLQAKGMSTPGQLMSMHGP